MDSNPRISDKPGPSWLWQFIYRGASAKAQSTAVEDVVGAHQVEVLSPPRPKDLVAFLVRDGPLRKLAVR